MSNSKLVTYTRILPHSNPREARISKITPHHAAGNVGLERLGEVLLDREASANYGIDSEGRVAMYVEERDRAWTSGNAANDHCAVTIEVANDGGAPDWHVSDKAIEALVALCVDICQRNGITALNFTGDATGNLTMHKMFRPTACPGPYLESRFPYIAAVVNKRLAASVPAKTSVDELAAEVIAGKWGVGVERKERLTAAGFDYDAVQAVVNAKLFGESTPAPAPAKKTVDELATEVIRGEWGSGFERKARLTAAGYDYDAVQARVNERLG